MEGRSRSNQQAMEQALGTLVIDAGFRDAFFSDSGVASEAAGIPLSDRERAALTRIRPGALAAFQRYLDRKKILANSVAAAACGMLLLAAPGHAQLPLQQPPTAQTESTTAAVIRPFRVNVAEEALVNLHRSIAATRWPDGRRSPTNRTAFCWRSSRNWSATGARERLAQGGSGSSMPCRSSSRRSTAWTSTSSTSAPVIQTRCR
jgi:hypothetical protein